MTTAAYVAVLLLLAPPPDDFPVDGPPPEWLKANAPYGFDLTYDGKVWVNTNPVGSRDDYAVLGNDLYKVKNAHSVYPRVWIRGYHGRNAKVRYRESKILVTIDCTRDVYVTERQIRYDTHGEVVETAGPFNAEPIIPGSVAESWRKAVCSSP